MRFFAHDGKTVLGPSPVEDLLKQPGFDGDTLVCPVGSENSADWKPALAYPPFREALLAPAPKAPPAPPPPPPTEPCPRCSHGNPQFSRFCNECGARMDGTSDTVPAIELPPAEPAPEPIPEPVVATTPAPELEPVVGQGPTPSPWRKALLAALVGAAAAGGGLGWRHLRSVRAVKPSAPAPAPTPAAAPAPAPAVAASSASAPAPLSAAPAPPPAPVAAVVSLPPTKATAVPAAKRAAKRRRTRALLIVNGSTRPAASTPSAPPAAAEEDKGFLLPGVPRRVAAAKPKPEAKAPAPTAEPAAAESAPDAADAPQSEAARQVRDQFDFCSQLLAQGAFGDHFDTCLCATTRQAAPYKGNRETYASALNRLGNAAKAAGQIESVAINGADAVLTIKTADGAAGSQAWRLEEGLWCRAP